VACSDLEPNSAAREIRHHPSSGGGGGGAWSFPPAAASLVHRAALVPAHLAAQMSSPQGPLQHWVPKPRLQQPNQVPFLTHL
jgi:hypothetical protein